jgi:sugar phosphate isomerase/epimerase
MQPVVAMANIFEDSERLRDFAQTHGFTGIDWSFDLETLPSTPLAVSRWVNEQSRLYPLAIRYHCPFFRLDLGHDDPESAAAARDVFRRIVRMVSKAGGGYLSIHIGLGFNSTLSLSWERSIDNLRELVQFGAEHQVRICLENLAWGWTSKPNLFEKLIRRSGAGVTLDIGHAAVCESVISQLYGVEDFVSPHSDRIFNAHVYDREVPGQGHLPPETAADIADRLALLQQAECPWWVIELKKTEDLLHTKDIVDQFLRSRQSHEQALGAAR